MSYILDALRRADAERERGAVPSLQSQQHTVSDDDAAPARPRSLVWAVVVLARRGARAARLELAGRSRAGAARTDRRIDHGARAGPVADASAGAGDAGRRPAGPCTTVGAAPTDAAATPASQPTPHAGRGGAAEREKER